MSILRMASSFIRTLRFDDGTYYDKSEASIMMGSWSVGFAACCRDGEDKDRSFL